MNSKIRKLGLANGIKPKGSKYSLSNLIQESYNVSYKAKKIGNKKLIALTESHISNIKDDPTKIKRLSEDLDVLKGLVKIGKDHKINDLEEVDKVKKRHKKTVESHVTPVKESWTVVNKDKNFKRFKESAKSKVFYKELGKFNKTIQAKKPITINEAISLYKACNSCLTHMTVELEKKPAFIKAYRECTKTLSKDTLNLLKCIQGNKVPGKALLENFTIFTNTLLECNTPEELDPEIYEDADLEELDDRDVINEDADLEELDDRDVIDEDADMEEIDDRDVINEDADLEELDDRDVLNEDADPESDDTVSVDLTPEEISLLKSVLGKISTMEEDDDVLDPELVDDEEIVPEPAEDEEDEEITEDEEIEDDPEECEDLEEDEDLEDDEYLEEDYEEDFEDEDDLEECEDLEEDEDLEDIEEDEEVLDDIEDDEELEEDEDPEDIEECEDPEDDLEECEDLEDLEEGEEVLDDLEDDEELEEDEDPIDPEEEDQAGLEDSLDLTLNAIDRIKKCF